MKENYESITCEVVMFDTKDIIVTSGNTSVSDGISGYGTVTNRP